jgi:hypothetical protein
MNFKNMLREKLETLNHDKQKFFKENGFEEDEELNDEIEFHINGNNQVQTSKEN